MERERGIWSKHPLSPEELSSLFPRLQNKKKRKNRSNFLECGEKARLNGFVQLYYLPRILGVDKRYSPVLPRLWHHFECDLRWGKRIRIKSYADRVKAWIHLVDRWTGIERDPRFHTFPPKWAPIRHLPLRNSKTNEEKEVGPGRSDADIVTLEDLKEYIENIGKSLNIDFPLPPLLFPEAQEEKMEVTDKADEPISNDYEAFIRSLQVWFQSDSEIKIKVPGRPAKIYNYASLDFWGEKAKTWKMLLEVLQDRDHSYNIGPAYKSSDGDKQTVKNYSNQLKRLDQINIKLGKFISKTYNRQMPKAFKIYERRKSEKPGTYGFKFQIGVNTVDEKIESRYGRYSEVELRSELQSLSGKFKKDPSNSKVKNALMDAATVAWEKKFVTKDQIENMIQSHRTLDLESKGGDRNEE